MIDEAVMDIALRHEFRHKASVLRKNGSESVQLGLFLTVYPHPVPFLYTFPYIFGKKFKILIE